MAELTNNNNIMDMMAEEQCNSDGMNLVMVGLGGRGEGGEPPPDPPPPPQSPTKPPLPAGPPPPQPPPPVEQPFDFTKEMLAEAAKHFCRDYLRGTCSRENCQYRHFITEQEFKANVQFCHDFQNKRSTGCDRKNCNFIHCTTAEENHFHKTGKLPKELMEKYNFHNLVIVPELPKSPGGKKARRTFLPPGAKKPVFSNGELLEEKKKLVPYPLDPPPPPGPPFQPPEPPLPPQMVEAPVPPPPPHIIHAAQMAAEAARPPLPPLPLPHPHMQAQQVVVAQHGPMPQGVVNPAQEMMPPALNVDFSKPPPPIAPPVPQQPSADGRMVTYGPVENPTFRHGEMEVVGYPMPMSGGSQPPYIETGSQAQPQQQMGLKRHLSPQMMQVVMDQPRPPPPPPQMLGPGHQQQLIVQHVHPGQEFVSMDGAPINGGVVQTMQDGRTILTYRKPEPGPRREARDTPQPVFQEQGDHHQPSGFYEVANSNGTISLVAYPSSINVHSSYPSQGLDEPEMKKPKLQDREVIRGTSISNTECKRCNYLDQSRKNIENDYLLLQAKYDDLKAKYEKLADENDSLKNFRNSVGEPKLSMNTVGNPQTCNSPTISHPQGQSFQTTNVILGPQPSTLRPEYQRAPLDMRDYGPVPQKTQAGQQHCYITPGQQIHHLQTTLPSGVSAIIQTQQPQGGTQMRPDMAPMGYNPEFASMEAQEREFVMSQKVPQTSQAGPVPQQYIRQTSMPQTIVESHQVPQQIYRIPPQQTATNLSFAHEYPRSSHEQEPQKEFVGPKPPPPPPQSYAYAYRQQVEQQQMSQPQQMPGQQQIPNQQQQISQAQMGRQQQEQINQTQAAQMAREQQMNQQQQQQMYQQQQQYQQQMQQQSSNNPHVLQYAQPAGSEVMYMQQHNVE